TRRPRRRSATSSRSCCSSPASPSASCKHASYGPSRPDRVWTSPGWVSSSSMPTTRLAPASGASSHSFRRTYRPRRRELKAQLRIESLVHGGEGLAHHEGRVVFVRGGAPGDVVEAEVRGDGRFEHARALRVVEAGASRVPAPCPIVEQCGGCPL